MWNRFRRSFINDINIISHDKTLLLYSLGPIILCIVFKLFFPVLSHYIFSKTGFVLYDYYSLVAITLISFIPAFIGIIYAFILLNEKELNQIQVSAISPAAKKSFLYFRIMPPALLSFIMLLIMTFLTEPVPSEGWLRSVFVSFLLSIQSTFVFLYLVSFSNSRAKGTLLLKLYGIFLAVIPFGLLFHHPWNYFLFFSPYYWISWAWVSYSTAESLSYGAISIAITAGYIVWFYTHLLKKNKT